MRPRMHGDEERWLCEDQSDLVSGSVSVKGFICIMRVVTWQDDIFISQVIPYCWFLACIYHIFFFLARRFVCDCGKLFRHFRTSSAPTVGTLTSTVLTLRVHSFTAGQPTQIFNRQITGTMFRQDLTLISTSSRTP